MQQPNSKSEIVCNSMRVLVSGSSAAGILRPAQRGSKKGSQWIYPENLVCVVFTLIKAFTLIKFKNIK